MITTNENDLYTKPKTQLTLLLKPKRSKDAKRAQNRARSKGQADPSWLYPILLPSIFPTLFCLYKSHHSDDDLQLRVAMSTLRQRTDKDLCEILDIKRYVLKLIFTMVCTVTHPRPIPMSAFQYCALKKRNWEWALERG